MTDFSPREIVSELDRYHRRPGRRQARRRHRAAQPLAAAAARPAELREEVLPKNILMIGPTGVGKTEISRRLAKLAGAPFIKVEATKFTEVGYVGRDVEQIIRDLVEVAIAQMRERKRKDVQARAQLAAEDRVLDALVGPAPAPRRAIPSAASCAPANSTTRKSRSRRRSSGGMPMFEIPGHAGRADGRDHRSATSSASCGGRTKTRRLTVADSHELAGRRGIRQAAGQRPAGAGGHRGGREQRHRVPRRDRQDLRARRPRRRRRLARRRAARSAAADRGHHGLDQARRGEDRPHPVHRVGRVPHRQAVRPAAGAAGPAADPRRAGGADAATTFAAS